jgi:parvulin-like peptidyl-prolyl isomerase
MVKPFEEAAFGQEIDAIGPVVETKFGSHIIQVLEKRAAGSLSRETVANLVRNRKSRSAMQRYVDQLRSVSKITYGPLLTEAAAQKRQRPPDSVLDLRAGTNAPARQPDR